MKKVGILGVGGYVAKELIRLLLGHPEIRIECLVSESGNEGQDISTIHQEFRKLINKKITNEIEALYDSDFVITSKPPGDSLQNVPRLIEHGLRVIDMSAAFRFKDPHVYEAVYKQIHTAIKLLPEAVYGLTEIYRDRIKDANLVANPGCYPISVILGCAPLIKNHLVDPQDIIVDAYSGISGAGANPSPYFQYLFCEGAENMMPYSVGEHRHTPEMEQELTLLAQSKATITFVPHLAPLKRGILSSIYLKLRKPYPSRSDLVELYTDFYKGEYFVRLMDSGEAPNIRNVAGTNFCDIGIFANGSSRIVVISAIDNLVKGAAGQAIQNLNVMLGIDETSGLVSSNEYIRNQLPSDFTITQLIQLPND